MSASKHPRHSLAAATCAAALALTLSSCGASSPKPPAASGTAENPFVTDFCRTSEPAPARPDEIVVDALVLPTVPDVAVVYGGGPPQPDPDGVTFYKAGIAVRADHPRVTIAIGAAARSYARIENESYHGPLSGGAQSITYAGKPRIPAEQGWTCWYVGGYNLLGGRSTACVPLDVTVAGDPATHHVAVPVGLKCPG
jgi:hypothetical protein